MSKVCQKTGKRANRKGNRRSHACNATKCVREVNLQKKRVYDPVTGKFKRMRVSTNAIKTLDKQLVR